MSRGRPKGTITNCPHIDRPHHCKGRCEACYAAFRRANLSPEKKEAERVAARGYAKKRYDKNCAYNLQWRKDNPDKFNAINRRGQLKVRYGITEEQYESMKAAQGNVCKLCGGPPGSSTIHNFNIDHCHITKTVRGLLCTKCNTGLGLFNDDPILMRKGASYVESHYNTLVLKDGAGI